MLLYHAYITWKPNDKHQPATNEVKFIPIIKSSALQDSTDTGWSIFITDMSKKSDGTETIVFHFVSPDAPPLLKVGDVFTLWSGERLSLEGRITDVAYISPSML